MSICHSDMAQNDTDCHTQKGSYLDGMGENVYFSACESEKHPW